MPVVRLAELPTVPTVFGRWQALNAPLGLSGFGINVLTADPGEPLDTLHDETDSNQEEVYVVVTGRAIFTLDGVEHEVGPGTLVSAAPSTVRSLRAADADTRVVCIGAKPGTGEEGFGAFIVPA
jgi:uncharacterized cupin superfamily protein